MTRPAFRPISLVLAGVLAAAGCGIAHASPESVVSVSLTGHDDVGRAVNLGHISGEGPGVDNSTGIFTYLQAGTPTIVGAFASPANGKLAVGAFTHLANIQALNTMDATSRSEATVRDTLTLSAAGLEGRRVVLHKELELDAKLNGFFHLVNGEDPSEFSYRLEGLHEISVSGDGLSSGPFGTSLFQRRDTTITPRRTSEGSVGGDKAILSFDLEFTLGEAREFVLSLAQFSTLSMEVFRDNAAVEFDGRADAKLSWLRGGVIRDVATGEAICGVTGVAASGFNYLKGLTNPACPVVGGPVSGAPEPAAWALMIAGFGLTGGLLRRRRPGDRAAVRG